MPDDTSSTVTSVPHVGAGAVLLIEDNRADALLIQSMLAEASDLPQTVLHTASLEAGLDILRHERIAVILLDLSLPDSSGLDTFQTLQRHAGGTPIIVLTGSRDRSLALRAIQEGAQDYLVKDEVNASTLSKAIHYAVERKQAEMRLRESENRYKTLVDSVPDAILLIRDGAIAHCNERAADLFGIPYDDLIGRDPSSLALPRQPDGGDSMTGFQAHLQKCRQDSPYLFEWQFQDANQALIATEVILDTVVLDGKPQVLAIIRDITDRKQAEQRIRFQASLLDQVHNAVLATDGDDRIIYWNQFATRLYLWPAELAMGRRFTDLIMPDAEQDLLHEIHRALADCQIWEGELELSRRDGSTFPALLTLSAILHESGRFSGCVGIASDITVRKEVERKLEHNAFHDALTGLPNRMLFADRLSHSIARGAREGGRYAVMVMDLDRFKIINDSLGHMVGDDLLIQFSRRVESCLRPQDTLARLGGDEFTILLDDIQHTSDAIRVAERIHEKMSQPFLLGGNEVYSSASIGITFGTANYKEPSQALRDADIAMYRAKSLGKGCHVIFEAGMHDRAVTQLKRENRIRRALERHEFGLHFQPIVDLLTGECIGAEALARWNSPIEACRSPQEFLALAEDSGLIIPIGQQLLDDACRTLQLWRQEIPLADEFTIHINLSTKQFCHRGLIAQIEDALRRYQLSGTALTLEITEEVLREHPVLATAMLGDLRELKVHVCIDDFGIGRSSLSYLHQFPLDILKIDRSFTAGLGTNLTSNAIVQAIIGLGNNLGMQTIAEGVEQEQHQQQLIELGCRYAQGYFVHPPLEPEAMTDYLRVAARSARH